MSRSGYCDDGYCDDQWATIRYQGAIASTMRGKRGQAFLKEMLAAMDALPEKKLVAQELELDGQVCAIGSVGLARGVNMDEIDPEDYGRVATIFGISETLAREIVYANDEAAYREETPEARFARMRAWIVKKIITP